MADNTQNPSKPGDTPNTTGANADSQNTSSPNTEPEFGNRSARHQQNDLGKSRADEAGFKDPLSTPGTEPEPADAVAILNAQVEDLTKRLLTAHADIQNLHKRTAREREETSKYAISKFASDTVAVADNFERAISSVPEGATADNPVLKALLEGVTMTEREFLNVLERHGVVRISPEGEIFDPHRHQAVMEENKPSVMSGTILKVFQPGYMIEDRVLRPAMVVVAKGGQKPPKPGEAANTDTGPAAPTAPANDDAPPPSPDDPEPA